MRSTRIGPWSTGSDLRLLVCFVVHSAPPPPGPRAVLPFTASVDYLERLLYSLVYSWYKRGFSFACALRLFPATAPSAFRPGHWAHVVQRTVLSKSWVAGSWSWEGSGDSSQGCAQCLADGTGRDGWVV